MAGNSEIVKAVLQLEVESKQLEDGLRNIAGQYAKTSAEIQKQQEEIKKLTAREAELLQARSRANNPTNVVRINQELAKVQAELKKVVVAEQEAAKSASKVGAEMKKAFDATSLKAAGNAIGDIEKSMDSTAESTEQVEVKAKSLKAQLKELKAQLASGDLDDGEFQRLAQKAGELQDRIDDAGQAAKVFASESKFEQFGSALGNVGQKILSLDFKGALDQSKLLLSVSKGLTFKEALGGIKDLGSTLANVGKALLTNPLFLIAGIIAGGVMAFNELSAAAERANQFFKDNGEALKAIREETEGIAKANRDLAVENDKLAGKISESDAKRIKNANKLKDEILKLTRERIKEEQAINERADKAREEDGFKLTKKIYEALGGETEITAEQKRAIAKLNEETNKRILELKKQFNLENEQVSLEDNKKQKELAEERAKKAIEIAKKENEALKKLRDELIAAQSGNRLTQIGDQLSEADQIQAKYVELQTQQNNQFKERRQQIAEEFTNRKKRAEALAILGKIQAEADIKLQRDTNRQLLDLQQKLGLEKIDIERQSNERLVEIAIADGTLTELEAAEAKKEIIVQYYQEKEQLLLDNIEKEKAAGFQTVQAEKELADLRKEAAVAGAKAADDVNKKRVSLQLEQLSEEERHQLALLEIQGNSELERLNKQIEFEEERLRIMREGGEATELELQKQANTTAELREKAAKIAKKAEQEQVDNIIAGIFQVVEATISAANTLVGIEQAKYDKLSSLQQKRVEEARNIADKGNAELLAEEERRLDDLNKKKEQFVRAQQTLAAIEMVANAGVAITKAAAEGGVAAPFTIATTVIALLAGLAQARSIAQQAAFYEGGLYEGQGYTGDGNPREAAFGVGKKPYTYHKQEFIFNHKTTNKYRDIFEDIHKGKVDLREIRDKAKVFDMMTRAGQAQMAQVLMPIQQGNDDIMVLKGELEKITKTLKSQGMYINIDSEGFTAHLQNIKSHSDFVRNQLAKP